ncbi:MAG: hypothetical protein M3463_04840, partial [Verrucomicrobiota bacterium]|nr:hypothetical protein [Verrucomicrobiota bacterium]
MKNVIPSLSLALGLWALCSDASAVTLVEAGQPKATVYLDAGTLTPAEQTGLTRVCQWVIEGVAQATGARLPLVTGPAEENTGALILTTAQAHSELVAKSGLHADNLSAYAISSSGERTYLIGANPAALPHAAAHLLRELRFRYYAPSPRWHVVPSLRDVRIDINVSEAPDVGSRSIWYAYGMPEKALMENYRQWVFANRLTGNALINTGHSYGNIIGRNAREFEAHPEYYA